METKKKPERCVVVDKVGKPDVSYTVMAITWFCFIFVRSLNCVTAFSVTGHQGMRVPPCTS